MTTAEAHQTLSVVGILKAVTPKHQEGDRWVGGQNVPKGNTLDLLISVNVPAPKPARDYDDWRRNVHQDYNSTREMQSLVDRLNKDLATIAEDPYKAKPPKGGHWFKAATSEDVEAQKEGGTLAIGQCIGHPKCGKTEPDAKKCFRLQTSEELTEIAQNAVNELAQTQHDKRIAAYQEYFTKCNEQTKLAMLASMGTGMFFALMGQELKVDFAPSDRIFQPMLDAAQGIAGTMQLPEVVADIPQLEAPKITFQVDPDDDEVYIPEEDEEDDDE